LLSELETAHYFLGDFRKAAVYSARYGFAVIRSDLASGVKGMGRATRHFLLYLATRLSKCFWLFSRRISGLRRLHQAICSPDQPEASLGRMLVEHGHLKFAEKHLRTACSISPNSVNHFVNLASCLALQHKKAEAITACDKAIELAPNDLRLLQYRKMIENEEVGTNIVKIDNRKNYK